MTRQALPLYRFRIHSIPPEGGAARSWVIDRVSGNRIESVYWRVPDGQPFAGGIRFVWPTQEAAYGWLEAEGFAPSTVTRLISN